MIETNYLFGRQGVNEITMRHNMVIYILTVQLPFGGNP